MDRILGEGSTRIRSHSVHIEGRELMSVSGVRTWIALTRRR